MITFNVNLQALLSHFIFGFCSGLGFVLALFAVYFLVEVWNKS